MTATPNMCDGCQRGLPRITHPDGTASHPPGPGNHPFDAQSCTRDLYIQRVTIPAASDGTIAAVSEGDWSVRAVTASTLPRAVAIRGAETPAAERCPTCDFPPADGKLWQHAGGCVCDECVTHCFGRGANCDMRAVDWRARAIAAEAERSAILALVSPSSDQSLPDAVRELCEQVEELRAAAAKWAKVAPLIERLRPASTTPQIELLGRIADLLAATEPTP